MLQSSQPSEPAVNSFYASTASQKKTSEPEKISGRNQIFDSANYLIGAGLVALAGIAVLIAFAALKRSKQTLPED